MGTEFWRCRGQGFNIPVCLQVGPGSHFPCMSLPVCRCVYGVCRHGPRGDGSCLCFAGYTGAHCDHGEQLLGWHSSPARAGWDLCLQPGFLLSVKGPQLAGGGGVI